MSRWFTSDQHFDHMNIIAFCGRPFSSVEEMNREIIDRWNSVVAEDDEVYVLGDFAMGHRGVSVPTYAEQLNGTKYLVPGNHDNVWEGRGERQRHRWTPVYRNSGFDITEGQIELIVGERWVRASHFPYHDIARHVGKFDVGPWVPEDDGETWLLHGHVHQAWQIQDRQINVGVDVWDFYPVAETTIMEVISGV